MKNLEYGIVLQYLQNSAFPEAYKIFYSEVKYKGGLDLPLFIKQAQNLPTIDASRQLTVLYYMIEGIQEQAGEREEILRQNAQITADLIGLKRNLYLAEQDNLKLMELKRQQQDDALLIYQLQQGKGLMQQELYAQKNVAQEAQYQVKKLESTLYELYQVNLSFQEKDRNYYVLSKDLYFYLEDKGNQLVSMQQKISGYTVSIYKMKQALAERDQYIYEITLYANYNVDNMKKYEFDSQKQISQLQEERIRLQGELQQHVENDSRLQDRVRILEDNLYEARGLAVYVKQQLTKIEELEYAHRNSQAEASELRQSSAQKQQELEMQQLRLAQLQELQSQSAEQFKAYSGNIKKLQEDNLQRYAECHYLQLYLAEERSLVGQLKSDCSLLKNNVTSLPEFVQLRDQLTGANYQVYKLYAMVDELRSLESAHQKQAYTYYLEKAYLYQKLDTEATQSNATQRYLQNKIAELEMQLSNAKAYASEAASIAEQRLSTYIQANYQLDARISEEISKSQQLEALISEANAKLQKYLVQAAEWQKKDKEIVQLNSRVESLKQENQMLTANKAELEKQIQELMAEQRQIQSQNFEMKLQDQQLKTQNQHLEARFADVYTYLRSQEQLIYTLYQSMAPASGTSLLTPSVVTAEEQDPGLAAKLKEAKLQISELRDYLAQFYVLEVRHNTLVQQYHEAEGARQRCEYLEQKVAEYEKTIKQLNDEISSQMAQIQQYYDSVKLQKQLYEQADTNLTQLQQQFSATIAQFKQDSEQNIIQMQAQKEYIYELSHQVQDLKMQNYLLNEHFSDRYDSIAQSGPEIDLSKPYPPMENSVVAVVQTARKSGRKPIEKAAQLESNLQEDAIRDLRMRAEALELQLAEQHEQMQALYMAAEAANSECVNARAEQESERIEYERKVFQLQRDYAQLYLKCDELAGAAVQSDQTQLMQDYQQQIELYAQCQEQKEAELQRFFAGYKALVVALPRVFAGSVQVDEFYQLDAVLSHLEAALQAFLAAAQTDASVQVIDKQVSAKINEILSQNSIFEANKMQALEILQYFIKSDQIQLAALTDELEKRKSQLNALEARLNEAELKAEQYQALQQLYEEVQAKYAVQLETVRAHEALLQEQALWNQRAERDAQVIGDQNALVGALKLQIDALAEQLQRYEGESAKQAKQLETAASLAQNSLSDQLTQQKTQNAKILDYFAQQKQQALSAQEELAELRKYLQSESARCEERVAAVNQAAYQAMEAIARDLHDQRQRTADAEAALARAREQAVASEAKAGELLSGAEMRAYQAELKAQQAERAKLQAEISFYKAAEQLNAQVLQTQQNGTAAAQASEGLRARLQEMQRQLDSSEDEKEELKQQMRDNALQFEKVVQQLIYYYGSSKTGASGYREIDLSRLL